MSGTHEEDQKEPVTDPLYTSQDQEAVKKKLDKLSVEQLRMVYMLVKQISGN